MEIINHECYVSPEVAKLLEQAGFDWKCIRYYQNDDKILYGPLVEQYKLVETNFNVAPVYMNQYSAPTLDVAQRWLREKKSAVIDIHTGIYDGGTRFDYSVFYSIPGEKSTWIKEDKEHMKCFERYEDALEAGINKCLTLLLKEE